MSVNRKKNEVVNQQIDVVFEESQQEVAAQMLSKNQIIEILIIIPWP